MTEQPQVTVSQMPGAAQANIDTSQAATPSDPNAPLVAPATPDAPTMPEGGQEKYWDAEKGVYNWEAAYKEEAWKASQKPTADPAPAEDGQAAPGDASAEAAAAQAGVDLDAFNTFVAENGEASPEHLEMFEKAGISADIVNDYVAMKLDQATQHVNTVREFLGGDNGIALLNDYMTKNFSDAEIAAFEAQMLDPGTWRAAAMTLLQSAGLPQGGQGVVKGPNAGAAAQSGERFNSDAEFNAAMRDPRYKQDPAYRARVQAALRNSPNVMSTGPSHTL